MGYNKTTWVDGENKYDIKTQGDVVIEEDVKLVYTGTAAGTAVSTTVMNNIESGIEAAHKGTHIYGASATASDTYTISFTAAFTAYNAGMEINLKVDVGNTGAATLNVDGLGAKTIKKMIVSGKTDLATNNMIAGGIYNLVYDGTDFILMNPTTGWVTLSETTISVAAAQVDITVPAGYKELELVLRDFVASSGSQTSMLIRFNDDSGNNYNNSASSISIGSFLYSGWIAQLRGTIVNVAADYKNFTYGAKTDAQAAQNQLVSTWHNATNEISKINLVGNSIDIASGTVVLRGYIG